MRTDPRSVLSGRPQAHTSHTTASRAVARLRAVGAVGALALLFALTTTSAWAEDAQDASAPTSTEPTPSESPSPEPTQTAEPSPSPSPTVTKSPAPSPTPSESTDDEGEDSEDDEDSDEDEDSEDSDENDSEDEPAPGDEPTTGELGDPVTDAPAFPTTVTPASFNPASRIISAVIEPAAEDEPPIEADFTFKVTPASLEVHFADESVCYGEGRCDAVDWDFGDGETIEDGPRFTTHTYRQPGTYDVTLRAWIRPRFAPEEVDQFKASATEDCSSVGDIDQYCTVTKKVTVLGPPNASFTAKPQSGPTPLTVKFDDTSTGDVFSREWFFNGPACGNASAGPRELHFTETFTKVDTCTVTLRAYAPPIPSPGPSDGPEVADFNENCNCSMASKTITVFKKPPFIPNEEDDDSDDSDDSDDESDDSDDDGDNPPGVFIPNQPPQAQEPTPEPTDPSPAPTSKPITPVDPTPPTPPTEQADPRPASWVTGEGASGAGLALMILAAVIGSMRGLSLTGQRVALVADRDENTIQRHVAARDAEGWGDRSFTWRFPGHRLIDAASVVLPDRLFRFSPLVGRIAEDGSEFRAMFGTLWLATPLAGIALGVASASAAGGRALPPSVWLVAAGAVLATFDAFAGAIAVVLFAGAALLGGLGGAEGGPDTVHSLLVILAIGFLWMAIPLIGSAIRPFRRLGDGSLRHRWDVVGDGLIAALLCGWVAQKLTEAMDLFAGQKTGLPEHANTVAIVVMAAVALRVSMEHFAVSAYPQRLQQVEGEDPPQPLLVSVVLGAFIRTAVFGFIGYAFIGSCWQLWLGIALFLIPQLIDHLRERFRNIGFVQRILPRGIVEIFLLVVTCTLIARYAMNQTPDEFTGLRMAFLLIAIPPALLGVLRAFAEDPDESGDTTWPREFLGALIVVVTAVLASRGWDY